MIYSTLLNSRQFENLHPKFGQLFDYIKNNDLLHAELGKIVLDDDKLFINNANPEMKPASEQILEVHRKYIDVHIPLDKDEIIGIKPFELCSEPQSEFNEENDCGFFNDKPTNFITLHPGEFLIVYPEDAHAPAIGEGKLRKLVVKIKI